VDSYETKSESMTNALSLSLKIVCLALDKEILDDRKTDPCNTIVSFYGWDLYVVS
jgi:hypothetical protein